METPCGTSRPRVAAWRKPRADRPCPHGGMRAARSRTTTSSATGRTGAHEAHRRLASPAARPRASGGSSGGHLRRRPPGPVRRRQHARLRGRVLGDRHGRRPGGRIRGRPGPSRRSNVVQLDGRDLAAGATLGENPRATDRPGATSVARASTVFAIAARARTSGSSKASLRNGGLRTDSGGCKRTRLDIRIRRQAPGIDRAGASTPDFLGPATTGPRFWDLRQL